MKSLINSMLILGAVGLIGGCSSRTTFTQADLETTPPVADEATRLRNFEPTTATYANGDTIAGNTGFNSTPERYRSPWQYYFIDSGVYLGNLFVSPFSLIMNHDAMRLEGLRIDPTYIANPVLPMSQSSGVVEPQPAVSPTPVTPEPAMEESIEATDEVPSEPMTTEELPVEPATPVEPESSTP